MTTTTGKGPSALQIDTRDNVGVALEDIAAGAEVLLSAGSVVRALNSIPFAHKLAIERIAAGASILKYGVPIAFATAKIEPGEWVHGHNAKSFLNSKIEYARERGE